MIAGKANHSTTMIAAFNKRRAIFAGDDRRRQTVALGLRSSVELFVQLLATLLRVLFPPLSHSIQACAPRDRTLSLGLAAFCNGTPVEHYREVRSSRSYSVFERKRQYTD